MLEKHGKALEELRAAGYAVIVWTPEELDGANPRKVEERSVELGWDVIDVLKPDTDPAEWETDDD